MRGDADGGGSAMKGGGSVEKVAMTGDDPRREGAELLSAEMRRELEALHTLQDVVRWGLRRSPAWEVVEVVVQDEYCHDVVRAGPRLGERQLYLCFDTT